MKQRATCAAAALITMTACGAASTKLTPAHRDAIVDSVQTMVSAWRDAFNARDFARAASFYATDSAFRWFENGDLKFASAAALRDTMLAEAPTFRSLSMSLQGVTITPVAPGVAEFSATFTETVVDTAGKTMGIAGAVSATAVHGGSGWRFLVGHSSTLLPSQAIGAPPGGAGARHQ